MTIKRNILLPPKVKQTLLLLPVLISSYYWVIRVFRYHFDFQWPDLLPLGICLVIPVLILNILKGKVKLSHWIATLLISVILLSLLPLTRFFIIRTEYSWMLCYLSLIGISFLSEPIHRCGAWIGSVSLMVWLVPFDFNENQQLYFDRVVENYKTRKSDIHKVKWKSEVWTYVNGRPTFSTADKHMFFEPLVHPIMHLAPNGRVLLIGGDDGNALSELRKYDHKISVIPWDQERFIASSNFIKTPISQFLEESKATFSAIILDLPDPIFLDVSEFYTQEFYRLCSEALTEDGYLVTQSLSPYTKNGISEILWKTVQSSGFNAVQYHNQIPTLGQWSWVLAVKNQSEESLEQSLVAIHSKVETMWWDQEAMQMMLSFGKKSFFSENLAVINTIEDPIIYQMLNAKN